MASGPTLVSGRVGHASFQHLSSSAAIFPVYDWSISAPLARVSADPLGSTFSVAYAEGMVSSRLTANIMVGKANSFIDQTTGFLQYFLQRTLDAASGVDTTDAHTIAVSDGNSLYTLSNAKPESFSLTVRKGQPLGLSVTYLAPARPVRTDDRGASLNALYNRNIQPSFALVMYKDVAFASSATPTGTFAPVNEGGVGAIYGFSCAYSNNHIINAPLDGTQDALSWDSGRMSGSCNMTVRAYSAPIGGPSVDPQPVTDGQALQLAITLSGGAQNLLLPNLVFSDDISGQANLGASFRPLTAMLFGSFVSTVAYGPICQPGNSVNVN